MSGRSMIMSKDHYINIMEAELEALKKDNEELSLKYISNFQRANLNAEKYNNAIKEIEALRKERDEYREALEWINKGQFSEQGFIAAQALAKYQTEKK